MCPVAGGLWLSRTRCAVPSVPLRVCPDLAFKSDGRVPVTAQPTPFPHTRARTHTHARTHTLTLVSFPALSLPLKHAPGDFECDQADFESHGATYVAAAEAAAAAAVAEVGAGVGNLNVVSATLDGRVSLNGVTLTSEAKEDGRSESWAGWRVRRNGFGGLGFGPV